MNEREHVLNAALLAIGLGVIIDPSLQVSTGIMIGQVFVPVVLGALFPDVDAHYGEHRKALHNVYVLGLIGAYPLLVGNLEWVWIGILTHYILDILGTTRGIAFFYPLWDREFGIPIGVPAASWWAAPMTVLVTLVELGVIVLLLWSVQNGIVVRLLGI